MTKISIFIPLHFPKKSNIIVSWNGDVHNIQDFYFPFLI